MEKHLYKNIYSHTLCVVAKNWKMRECPLIGKWLNKLWYLLVMEYYCAQRNNELEEFHVNWKDLQELMQSERSRTRRPLYTEADTLVKSNVIDSSASSNAMIQDNCEGLIEKNTIHMQRKNYRSGNTEEKQLLKCMG